MIWRIVVVLALISAVWCPSAQAEDRVIHLGPLGQLKANPHGQLAASLGASSSFDLGVEVHTSAWINFIGATGGGLGGGTIHHLSRQFLLGWEFSAEYEKKQTHEVWFLGAGPVFEACATKQVHLFLKAPVGWERIHHHDQFSWSVVVGISVFLLH